MIAAASKPNRNNIIDVILHYTKTYLPHLLPYEKIEEEIKSYSFFDFIIVHDTVPIEYKPTGTD